MLITPWIIIISVSILFGFIFSINIFLQNKGNKTSNRFLALFLLAITVLLLSNIIVLSNLYKIYPHLIGLSFLLWYILPPLFYFYVKTGIYTNYKFAWHDLLHLLPLIYMLYRTYSFYLLPAEIKLEWFESFLTSPKSLSLNSAFIITYSFIYLAMCIYLIIDFEKNYKKDYANTSLEHIDGIKRLVLVYAIYKILDLVGMGASFFSTQSATEIMQFISISLTIFIFVITYTFLKQPEKLFQSEIVKTKYKTSSLSESDLVKYSQKLDKVMNDKKLFLESDIKLSDLAEALDISTHILSQVINQHYKMNFYDYVNSFRVEEVKSQLLSNENKNFTILSIAFEAGFKSKSSFNKIFKKNVGKSPSEFMKENGIGDKQT